MHPEAAFLAGYSLALTLVAVGLEWLGRRSTDPWASRTLAACRRPTQRPSDAEPDWPHSEVPTFHLGLAAVALVAASVITSLSAVRHAGRMELLIHGGLLVIITVRIRHVFNERRNHSRRLRHLPGTAAVNDSGRPVVAHAWRSDAERGPDM